MNGEVYMRWSQLMRLLLVAAAFAWSVPVDAQDCNVKVYDPEGYLRQGAGAVEQARKDLETLGADARVVVLDSVPNGGESYLEAIRRRCPEWKSADDDYRNNIVVVFVAVESRDSTLIVGGEWERMFGDRVNDIRTDRMIPRFRDGDIAGGVKNALIEVGSVIKVSRTALPNGSGPVTVNVEAPSTPTDLTGLWWFLGIVLVLAIIGAAVFAFIKHRAAEALRKTAQNKAKSKKAECVAEVNGIEAPINLLNMRVGKLAQRVVEDELKDVRTGMSTMQLFKSQAIRSNAALDNSANDPGADDRSVEDYDRIAKSYAEVHGRFAEVHALIGSISVQCGEIERRADGAAARLQVAEEKVDAAKKAVDAFAAKGFKAESASGKVSATATLLQTAKTKAGENRFKEAVDICGAVDECCGIIDKVIADAEKAKVTIGSDIATNAARIATVEGEIAQAKPVFEAIAAEHPESAWASVAGNGTEAEKRVDAARECLDDARDASSMEEQEWEEANASIAEAVSFLDQASSFMRSIHALKRNLDIAKRDAAKEIDDAQADIETAEKYIKTYDDDIRDSLWDDLKSASELLGLARALLSETKPDYLRVLELAKQVNANADGILEIATGEHDEAERIRRRDVSAHRDAVAACSKAKEYIEDHSADVGDGARKKLGVAHGDLSVASGMSDRRLSERIARHEDAKSSADQAYDDAQADVARAEAAREAERARIRRERERQEQEDRRAARVAADLLEAATRASRPRRTSTSTTDFGGWGSPPSRSGASSGGFGSSRSGIISGGFGASRSGKSSGKW